MIHNSRKFTRCAAVTLAVLCIATFGIASADEPNDYQSWSGIYPHLAHFNNESECGTGAVVPWAGKLWVITYAPHKPQGSTDLFYEIDEDLIETIRPESIGGTPANRMIHAESEQLFIGPYVVDRDGNVRTIPYVLDADATMNDSAGITGRTTMNGVVGINMPGRHTGNARHLTDPETKIYCGTMEEGFYEIDVETLEVTELYSDTNAASDAPNADLPGYHGKGLYSGQGRLIYANNGEYGSEARTNPNTPSGGLAEWDGENWNVVRRNQFTEVTGPGGIYGNPNPETDPIWSIGWDHRSLILMLLDEGEWHAYRLPKAAHTYDGAHGWNTEWPRIRDIGEDDLLMTMHGTFWRFSRTFTAANSAGIAPRSTYLKVIGDFCRWNDRLVFGCDDTARSEFLNKRQAKGDIEGPGQSQSNLWFADPAILDQLGPVIGRGALWVDEPIEAGVPTDPFLFSGYERRSLHLSHGAETTVGVSIEVDLDADGTWSDLLDVEVPPGDGVWTYFDAAEAGVWIRLTASSDAPSATAYFQYSNKDERTTEANAIFAGILETDDENGVGGLIRVRGADKRTLHMAAVATTDDGYTDVGYYEIDQDMQLTKVDDPTAHAWLKEGVAIPEDILIVEDASVLFIDDNGQRFRLPKGDLAFDGDAPFGLERIDREVCTERDLFNCYGTFYELPAKNAGGFPKIRPIATHNRRIHDYCSWRGLLVMTGIDASEADDNPHILKSDDGQAAVWVGAVDDLWKFGKPVGRGGPWMNTPVKADVPSDPYLMTGYDRKSIELSHDADESITIRVEVDVTGDGQWQLYQAFDVPSDETVEYVFPEGFSAYWVRTVSSTNVNATAQLTYE